METVRRLRAMALLCRQAAAYHPDRSWKLLAEAEYWEHLASAALLAHFRERNTLLHNMATPQYANETTLKHGAPQWIKG